MRNEHALTYRDKITMKELDYLVKKANRLGKIDKDIVHVYQTEDAEGYHIYFEVNGHSPEKKENA